MKKRASVMQRIGFVVFPDFEVLSLDTATVFEVANVVARKELYELHVLSDSGGPVRTSIGVAAQQGYDRAALILMDYAGRARLKIYAHVAAVPIDAGPVLARLVADAG
jgi:transcriptional regulator GlxA family with amidase domain